MKTLLGLIDEFGPWNCWRQGHAWLPCIWKDIKR